jgi:serine/threonine protein kinase
MCLALKYCHDQNVLHGDIKTSNIFLTENGDLKLGDFGTATNLAKTVKSINAMTGTPLFFAPEIIHGHSHSFKADVWALGVVFYQLLGLQFPFFDTNFASLLTKILEQEAPPLPDTYSVGLREFVMGLLVKDETKRPEMMDICSSDWFQNALARFPEEKSKTALFTPQMRIRITENFLQKEFEAIRVFRFSEDHSSSANSSFRMSSNSSSFINIFQSNCIGENDPKKTQKMLSRFARMVNEKDHDSDSSLEFTEESKLLNDEHFGKPGRSAKMSTNDTDKGVKIGTYNLHGNKWDLGVIGVLFHQNASINDSATRKKPVTSAASKLIRAKTDVMNKNLTSKHKLCRAESAGNMPIVVGKPVSQCARRTQVPAASIATKNGRQRAHARINNPKTPLQTSLSEMPTTNKKRSSMIASTNGSMHPAEWFLAIKKQKNAISSKQTSTKNLASRVPKASSSNSLFPKKYKILTEKVRPFLNTGSPTPLDPALLLQLIDAGSLALRQTGSLGPSATNRNNSLTAEQVEEARRTLINLVQPQK